MVEVERNRGDAARGAVGPDLPDDIGQVTAIVEAGERIGPRAQIELFVKQAPAQREQVGASLGPFHDVDRDQLQQSGGAEEAQDRDVGFDVERVAGVGGGELDGQDGDGPDGSLAEPDPLDHGRKHHHEDAAVLVAELVTAIAEVHHGHRQQHGERACRDGRPFRQRVRPDVKRERKKPENDGCEDAKTGDQHFAEAIVQRQPIVDEKQIVKGDRHATRRNHGDDAILLRFGLERPLDQRIEFQPSSRRREFAFDGGERQIVDRQLWHDSDPFTLRRHGGDRIVFLFSVC